MSIMIKKAAYIAAIAGAYNILTCCCFPKTSKYYHILSKLALLLLPLYCIAYRLKTLYFPTKMLRSSKTIMTQQHLFYLETLIWF